MNRRNNREHGGRDEFEERDEASGLEVEDADDPLQKVDQLLAMAADRDPARPLLYRPEVETHAGGPHLSCIIIPTLPIHNAARATRNSAWRNLLRAAGDPRALTETPVADPRESDRLGVATGPRGRQRSQQAVRSANTTPRSAEVPARRLPFNNSSVCGGSRRLKHMYRTRIS